MVTPTDTPPEPEKIEVDRHQVEGLRDAARTLVAIVVALGLVLAYSSWQGDNVDERQDGTDQRLDRALDDLETQTERLDRVIEERAAEVSRVAALECVRGHVRYELLSRALEVLADTDAEAAEALGIFPNPDCDLGEAQAELAGG